MRGTQRRGQSRTFFYAAAASIAAAAWVLTPLADSIASVIVDAIPLAEDVALGERGVQQANYRLLAPCRTGRRCVDEIGNTVIRTLLENHRQLAPKIHSYNWKFGVTSQRFVNAFAYPGGRIFVTDGLLDLCTDDELLAVIGHEVGHVLHRHSQKRMVRQRLGSVLLSALLSGDADNDGHGEGFGIETAGLLLQHASALSSMTYSRTNEFEADELGWYLCAATAREGRGCHSRAMQSFFRKLDGGTGATEWDSTHPGTADRIKTLDETSRALERGKRVDHFAPEILKHGATSAGETGLQTAGALLVNALPSEALRALVVGALWQGAALLEVLWDAFVEESPPPPPYSQGRRPGHHL